MSTAFYNDIEPYVCDWLENLITADLVTYGAVDRRPIQVVDAETLRDFSRAHFFAGIGGWDLALQLAGWPDDEPVWTGSCPCQPFSSAGRRRGTDDSCHLWPDWYRLISQCRPPVVFGEQVASPLGREWLSGVRADMEALGYRFAAADLCAAGVGAPHIRQRLWWVADAIGERRARLDALLHGDERGRESHHRVETTGGGENSSSRVSSCGLGHDDDPRLEGRRLLSGERYDQCSPWSPSVALSCRDGVSRRISPEPGLFPLAPRLPGHVARIRAAGNSIVPQVAATFIRAYLDCLTD